MYLDLKIITWTSYFENDSMNRIAFTDIGYPKEKKN